MPCVYEEFGPGCSPKKNELQDELNLVTRVACGLNSALKQMYCDYASPDGVPTMNTLNEMLYDSIIDKEIHTWITNHEKKDKERLENLKKNALDKLNDEEKEALGLK